MKIYLNDDWDLIALKNILDEWLYKDIIVIAVDRWHKRADVKNSYEMSKLELQYGVELLISGEDYWVEELKTRLQSRFG